MPKRDEDKYLDTQELEKFIDELKDDEDEAKIAERERMKRTLKQKIDQAVGAARNAQKEADAELDAAPRHLKPDYEEKLAKASEKLARLLEKHKTLKEKYGF
jgi:hypothetical protein